MTMEKILRGEKTKKHSIVANNFVYFIFRFASSKSFNTICTDFSFILHFRSSFECRSFSFGGTCESYNVSSQRTFSLECVFRSASVISMGTFQRHHFTHPMNEQSHRSLPHFHPKMHLDVVNSVSLSLDAFRRDTKKVARNHIRKREWSSTLRFHNQNEVHFQLWWCATTLQCPNWIIYDIYWRIWVFSFCAVCLHFMMARANISIPDDCLK